jgi:hypothetical protein
MIYTVLQLLGVQPVREDLESYIHPRQTTAAHGID